MNRASAIVLSARERHFIDTRRIGHLATADAGAAPHVVPVCFGLVDDTLYITIDRKPKRASDRPSEAAGQHPREPAGGHRLRPLRRGLAAARLGHAARAGGDPGRRRRARPGAGAGAGALPASSSPCRSPPLPVIAIRIERVASWGDLGVYDFFPRRPSFALQASRLGSISPTISPPSSASCLIRGRLGRHRPYPMHERVPGALVLHPVALPRRGHAPSIFRSRVVTFAGSLASSDQGR